MMQILERIKRKGKYIIVMLSPNGQKTEYTVSEDMIVEHRLIEGKIFDDFAFSAFMKAHHIDTIYQRIVKDIIRKPRTTHEVKSTLSQSDLSFHDQEYVIKKLTKLHLLDDDKLTQSVIDYQIDVLGIGPKKIDYDLQKRGIRPEIIQNFLNQIDPEVYQKHLERSWSKILGKTVKQPMMKTIEVAKRFFYDKGYPESMVKDFIVHQSHILKEEKDDWKLLQSELEKQRKKLSHEQLEAYQYKRKLITRLVQKGYRYEDILSMIEGDSNDELSDE